MSLIDLWNENQNLFFDSKIQTLKKKLGTCSWRRHLKTRSFKVISWKVRHKIGKNEVGKLGPKLEKLYLWTVYAKK